MSRHSLRKQMLPKIAKVFFGWSTGHESIYEQLGLKGGQLLKYVDKQKLKYNGHVTRHDYLDWSILDWKVDGSRGRGRPRRQWIDGYNGLVKYGL